MPVNSQKYCLVNSSVTHDIEKIDGYSVYRRLGNTIGYRSNITIIKVLSGTIPKLTKYVIKLAKNFNLCTNSLVVNNSICLRNQSSLRLGCSCIR